MTSEPVTAVIVMERTSGLSIRNEWSSISSCSIKTHGSELRGQEEAACMRVFWPTRPLQ